MILKGKTVFEGAAVGPVYAVLQAEKTAARRKTEDPEKEKERLYLAREKACSELTVLYEKALAVSGEETASIFLMHRMILEDEIFFGAVEEQILSRHLTAEYALLSAEQRYLEQLAVSGDAYLTARTADVEDVTNRVLRILAGRSERKLVPEVPSVIVADQLSPSESMSLPRDRILAFVTSNGSLNSHTAILARTMSIPAVTGIPLDTALITTGMTAAVNGYTGEVVFDPTEEVCRQFLSLAQRDRDERRSLEALKGKEDRTVCGRKMAVYANISGVADLPAVLEQDASGIGLFRSEFLYLGRTEPPSEEEQLEAYRAVLTAMGDREVIIRTMDLGADKQASCLPPEKEENPALGLRGIRQSFRHPDLFRVQLRALLRAAPAGKLKIMYPMITSAAEIGRIQSAVKEAAEELNREGLSCQIPPQGIMIETPAAALVSDELAERADFFSIGTNDLIQYTLAADRQNEAVSEYVNPHHRAVLRMIEMSVKNGHKKGIPVGICGELGADPELTALFLQMGVDEISVAPPLVLKMRKRIRETDLTRKEERIWENYTESVQDPETRSC